MTVKLNYLSFIVSDMKKALDFYRTLGLPVPADADASADHVEIEVNGLRIAWDDQKMIESLPGGWRSERTASTGHGRLVAGVEAASPAEVDAAVERLRAAGYRIRAEPYDALWGQRYATVLDPDGTPIDVFAWQK